MQHCVRLFFANGVFSGIRVSLRKKKWVNSIKSILNDLLHFCFYLYLADF